MNKIEYLKIRANILNKTREFFLSRDILEVETPLLCSSTVPDLHLHSFKTQYYKTQHKNNGNEIYTNNSKFMYLQTSPEYCMKRLLAEGFRSIYQICKAFRNAEEVGKLHNPEFTLLEWYRIDFDYMQLMKEVGEYIKFILPEVNPPTYRTYSELFLEYANINPHLATKEDFIDILEKLNLLPMNFLIEEYTKTDLEQLIMSLVIEKKMSSQNTPIFVYDYPLYQCGLAKTKQIRANDEDSLAVNNRYVDVAERFELYLSGMELANGYSELLDSKLMLTRFKQDLKARELLKYESIPIDFHLLDAMQKIPNHTNYAGVALGLDRLIMIACNTQNISDILSFTFQDA